ncbi:MAG: enoyl-CoA hydratase [Mucilaginibacter sp.]|nr:enoyl-CoA hydratase [Mucilaginibacter sp.]
METIKIEGESGIVEPIGIIEETTGYWRVVFNNPPINLVDAAMYEALQILLDKVASNPNLRVIVFESANPDFFLAHFSVADPVRNAALGKIAGPSGLMLYIDTFVRLSKSPVVSIAKLRGRARGAGSEFALACDIRFASLENTILSQLEVGTGLHPGGGGTKRLARLVGRGRALEIILGSDDIDGKTAELYGYVNRAFPDSELDAFVDNFARRIASFDQRPLAAAKNLVNQFTLPSTDELLEELQSFRASITWPETQERFKAAFAKGLNQYGEFELNYGKEIAKLLDK